MNRTLAALALMLTVLPALAGAAEMQPGMWEITSRTEMQGMPKAMPPRTIRHCYTKKDIEDKKPTMPQSQDKNCEIKDYQVQGNKASWSMECTGENAMRGSGTMTVEATKFSGTMKSQLNQDGQMMDITQSWSGKRLGDCK
jgi:uncharacterized protein DUF3617